MARDDGIEGIKNTKRAKIYIAAFLDCWASRCAMVFCLLGTGISTRSVQCLAPKVGM